MKYGGGIQYPDVSELTDEQRAIARRWCVFNSWGWPADVPMPESPKERADVAWREMSKAMHAIGYPRCLSVWNSEAFKLEVPGIQKRYDWLGPPGPPVEPP